MKKIFKSVIIVILFLIINIKASAKNNDITLYLFHGDGCPHCKEEIKFLDSIKNKYPNLKIKKYEVWYNEENAQLLQKVEKTFKLERSGVPTTIIGNTVTQGYGNTTGRTIENAIKYYSKENYTDQIEKIKKGNNEKEIIDYYSINEEKNEDNYKIDVPKIGSVNLKKVSLLTAAVVIGIIDGFNPCAMWILLFLISVLIGIKNQKRMIILGLTFIITSGIIYMLIMLSWIQIAVKITSIIWIRNIIALIALIGAAINLKSFLNTKNTGCEVVDDKKRKKIFKRIRKFTNEKSFVIAILGIMGLAASVNIVELACSAGLPLVFSELMVLNNVEGIMKILYTLLYIFFFLLDDLIVFIIAVFTMKITGISTKYNKYSHLLGGIIMLIVGLLLLIKPEWLMFQFK